MKILQLDERQIQGISIRTTNADEMNPKSARIAGLYQRFDEEVRVDYRAGERVYGVYFDYESDATGEFSVLAGSEQALSGSLELEQIRIPAGRYMVFAASGEMPQVVIDTWSRIWEYYASDDVPYKRAYSVDFEYYKSPNEIEIYIAIL